MGFWSGKRILIGVSGGVAAYKTLELIRRFKEAGADVSVAVTRSALEFVGKLSFQALSENPVHDDLFSPTQEMEMGHIALARKPDLAILAPATADLLSRMASGRAEDLLSTLLLARRGPVLAAPSMNTAMWEHPATRRNVKTLKKDGIHFVGPGVGDLACGETGAGRLAETGEIMETARRVLSPKTLTGRKLLVTVGPTREELDPVRYISNHSSGLMGHAAAQAALRAGAEVVFVHGPLTDLAPPLGAKAIAVTSAREMHKAAKKAWPGCDAAVLTAAVADYRPAERKKGKIKKKGGSREGMAVELVANPDILAELSAKRKPGQVVVGFAAETGDLIKNAKVKLAKKGCDLIVANDVTKKGSGFGSPTNRVTLISAQGKPVPWPEMEKEAVGERLMEILAERLKGVS